ncbi:MAG: SDR family oxidoreductase [Burkholderiales bacterium]|nr:MAG: SDR family oxidoreductase [Burkholderiales bacterium]
MANMEGKTILVTGGTTGIGRAIAIELARAGARVLIFGRHQRELDDALAALEDTIGEAAGMIADQSRPEDVRKVFAKAKSMGGLDAVIANAGIAAEGLADISDEAWRYAMETNLLGYLDVAKRAAEAFEGRAGDIILIGSVSADNRTKGTSVYTATKSGIQGFADAFRKEMGEKKIRVSLIEPGAVGSDMQECSPEEQRAKIAEAKMLKAEDIAELVMFILTRPSRCTISSVRIEERVQS